MFSKFFSLVVLICMLVTFICPVVSAGPQNFEYALDSVAKAANWYIPSEPGEGGTRYSVNTNNGTTIQTGNYNNYNILAYCQEINWSGKYTYRVNVNNTWGGNSNLALVIFNYTNNNNYYYVTFGGSDTVTNVQLWKRVAGNNSIVQTYDPASGDGPFFVKDNNTTIEVTYNNGHITVKGIKSTQEFSLIDAVDNAHSSGKIGVGAISSAVNFSRISVTGTGEFLLLSVDGCDLEDNAQNVALTPEINTVFNMPVLPDTVNANTVRINTNPTGTANYLPEQLYKVKLKDDGRTVNVSFVRPLEGSKNYRLEITRSVHSVKFVEGMLTDFTRSFTTVPPDFEVRPIILTAIDGSNILNNIAGARGMPAKVTIPIKNNSMAASQPYSVTFGIKNATGEMVFNHTFTGELARSASTNLIYDFTVPDESEAGATAVVYAWDSFTGLKKLYNVTPVPVSDDDFFEVNTNIEDDTMTIKGFLPNQLQYRTVNILVLNPEGSSFDIQNQTEIKTEPGGAFEYTFRFFWKNVLSGDFIVYVGGDDIQKPIEYKLYAANPSDRKSAIGVINSAADYTVVLNKLLEYKSVLQLSFPPFDAIDLTNLSKIVLAKAKVSPFNPEMSVEIQSFIRKYSLIEAYNQSKKDVIFNASGDFLYPDIILNLEIDKNNAQYNNKLEALNYAYNFYNNSLTLTGKKKVQDSMCGSDLVDLTALQSMLKKQAVVFGINNCNINGYGHIKQLIEFGGKDKDISLDLTRYNSAKMDSKLILENVDSLVKLQNLINSLGNTTVTPPGGGGGGGGNPGTSSSSVFSVSPDFTTQVDVPVLTEKPSLVITLDDMNGVEWAKESVIWLIENNIVSEPADGNFRPNDNITREEFVKMVVLALKLNISNADSGFEDVPDSHWSAPFITVAKNANIVNGISPTSFGPGEPMTRQDAAVIMYRAFKQKIQASDEGVTFSDMSGVSQYAVEAVENLTKASVINGMGDGRFAPFEYCTRAQCARILFGVLKLEDI